MHPARLARAALVPALAAVVLATASCTSLEGSIKDLTHETAAPTTVSYPAKVTGGGTPMSQAGCEKFKDQDPKPLECQPVPKGQAYLAITQGSQTSGQRGYVDISQFSATCTKDDITIKGPGGASLVFKNSTRRVTALKDGTALGVYQDSYLWWITHTSVSTNGTNKVGGATVEASVRVTCEMPEPTKDPLPPAPQTPEPAQSALTDEPS